MIINLKSSGVELTDEITSYLNRRLESVKKFLPERKGSAIVNVEFNRVTKHHAGDVFLVEINILVNGRIFHSASKHSDLYGAIDLMKDEITRELGSYKEKRLSLLKRGGQKIKSLIRGLSSDKDQ